jgi:hypothetical protein
LATRTVRKEHKAIRDTGVFTDHKGLKVMAVTPEPSDHKDLTDTVVLPEQEEIVLEVVEHL